MEFGLIPKIMQYENNKSLDIEKVHASNETSKLNEQNKSTEVKKEDFLKAEQTSNVEKTTSERTKDYHEVVLTNTNFGFNDSSKDFFVRAVRGNSESQYPTEQMMRLKSYLMNLEPVS